MTQKFEIDDKNELRIKPCLAPESIVVQETENGKIVALVNLILIYDVFGGRPCGYIHHVNTAQTSRGKGRATKLVRKAIEIAKARNCYKVFLTCNKSLVDFYKGAGMREYQVGMDIRF